MHEETGESAFGFHGTWREFAPIAFTNLLLTIVTLGIYRFWAKARERQYLWSRTRFIDERLEWTGTGFELFMGAVLVLFIIILPFFGAQFLIQKMTLNGQEAAAGILSLVILVAFFYLIGVARFRAIRYRLGRTNWRGIRGGSDDQGFRYGVLYIVKNALGTFALFLLIPWAMVSLWNDRWSKMSFGPMRIDATAAEGGLLGRFLLSILAGIVLVGVIMGAFFAIFASAITDSPDPGQAVGMAIGVVFLILLLYFFGGLIFVSFYAAFFRHVVGGMSLGDLDFEFQATTWDWLKLIAGDVALVVLTLGLGFVFLGYRHWKFFVVHMQAYGEINVDDLTQSTTRRSKHGEGLLDAFDMGAI